MTLYSFGGMRLVYFRQIPLKCVLFSFHCCEISRTFLVLYWISEKVLSCFFSRCYDEKIISCGFIKILEDLHIRAYYDVSFIQYDQNLENPE